MVLGTVYIHGGAIQTWIKGSKVNVSTHFRVITNNKVNAMLPPFHSSIHLETKVNAMLPPFIPPSIWRLNSVSTKSLTVKSSSAFLMYLLSYHHIDVLQTENSFLEESGEIAFSSFTKRGRVVYNETL